MRPHFAEQKAYICEMTFFLKKKKMKKSKGGREIESKRDPHFRKCVRAWCVPKRVRQVRKCK